MSLSIGIVGLPNVGKSTLFNALTDNNILAANYPFATIEPNTGIVPVPDERLEKLAGMYASQKIIPASVTFVDIAGLVAGASQGEGLGNQFLANIRNCQAICHVVRAFADPNVLHVDDTAGRQHDPKKDIDVINTELVLADLQSLQKRLPVLEKEARANPKLSSELNAMKFAKDILDSGTPLFASERAKELDAELSQFQLLTTKPIIYLFNVDETSLTDRARQAELSKMVAPSKAVFVCAKLEHELKSLDSNDQAEMLQSYGVNDSGLKQVIMAAYKTLGLQSYLTAGPKETRAWTVQIGASAPQAAGVIHTDFEKGFIAAQIVDYDDLLAAGSEQAAKQAGKVRTEGKDYIMQPGDVVEFRFNV